MKRKIFFLFTSIFLVSSIIAVSFCFAVETLTITTYYPSPYGVYNDLLSWRMAVGDNDGSGAPNTADIPAGLNAGDLVLSGKLGIGTGTTVPTYRLEINGCAGGFCAAKPDGASWTVISDIRLKDNIQPIKDALEKISKLRGVTYQWKNPKEHADMTGIYMGMIAQEVETVFPEWVNTDLKGYKNITSVGFEALVVESIKTLKEQIERINSENSSLKLKNIQLEARLNELEEKIGLLEKTATSPRKK